MSWWERLLSRFGVTIPQYVYDVVYGSRKAIKDPNNPNQDHYYKTDLWTEYGKKIADLLPEGTILYGELVGWVPGADAVPIQKGYSYHLSKGECELYVYRVSNINAQGHLSDLSWDGLKDFCRARGLKWVPEIGRLHLPTACDLDADIDELLDVRYADEYVKNEWDDWYVEQPLPLSDKKTVDEGVCLRQEGLVPVILKAKSPKFLEHETRLLDKGEVDLESAA